MAMSEAVLATSLFSNSLPFRCRFLHLFSFPHLRLVNKDILVLTTIFSGNTNETVSLCL